jgi:hypothetical protein
VSISTGIYRQNIDEHRPGFHSKAVNLLLEISRELTAALDLHTVLERVLSLSTGSIGVERASLIVIDDRKKPIDAAIMVDGRIIAHRTDQLPATIESGLAGRVIKEKKSVWIKTQAKTAAG